MFFAFTYFEVDAVTQGTIDLQHTVHQTLDKGHGRIETRSCVAVNVEGLKIPALEGWHKLKTIARITSIREENRAQTTAIHYFISSLVCESSAIASAVRQHWAIENSLH